MPFSATYPAGKYYIGDISYVLACVVYDEQWGGKYEFASGTFEFNANGTTANLSAVLTCYDDGTYVDTVTKKRFSVDSGNIGIVPVSLCVQGKLARANGILGHVIESATPVTFSVEKGIFEITYEHSTISIKTGSRDRKRGISHLLGGEGDL